MTTVAVIQARQTSTRLPGKVTLPLAGVPVIAHIVERARQVPGVDAIRFTVPDGPGQAPLVAMIESLPGVGLSFGPEDDLVHRLATAARDGGAETVLRIWSDCPVLDPDLAGRLLAIHAEAGAGYANIPLDSGFPEGMEAQVYATDTLLAADAEATDPVERETVFPFVERQPSRFPAVELRHERNSHAVKVLLDTPEDYARLEAVFEALYPDDPAFGVDAVEDLARRRPEIFGMGAA